MTQTEPQYDPQVDAWLKEFLGASEDYFIQWLREEALVEVS